MLLVVHEGVGVGARGTGAPGFQLGFHLPVVVGLANHALRAPGHLGHHVRTKVVHQQLQRAVRHLDFGQVFEQGVAHGFGPLADDRVALGIRHHALLLLAVLVQVGFVLHHGERLLHHLHQLVARRQVQVFQVGRFVLALALGQRPRLLRLVGVDQLQHHRLAGGNVALDLLDHRGHLHAGDDLVEKALLRAPVGRLGRHLGRAAALAVLRGAGHFQRLFEVLQRHLPAIGHAVVNVLLQRRQLVLDARIAHALKRQAARNVGAHLLHVARHQLHGGQAAGGHLRNERCDARERG